MKKVKYVIDPSVEMALRELRETVEYRKSRPLIRLSKHNVVPVVIAIDLIAKVVLVYLLWP